MATIRFYAMTGKYAKEGLSECLGRCPKFKINVFLLVELVPKRNKLHYFVTSKSIVSSYFCKKILYSDIHRHKPFCSGS